MNDPGAPQFDWKAIIQAAIMGTGLPSFAKDALLDAAVAGLLGAAARLAKRASMTGADFNGAAMKAGNAQGL